MADPLMQSVCCQEPHSYSELHRLLAEIDSEPYNIVCFISSAVGIFGAVYLMLPRVPPENFPQWYITLAKRGRRIIVWLAFADLLASLGIFFRSALRWMKPAETKHLTNRSIQCVILAFWVQYFFVVSWFWTLVYAVDIWQAFRNQPSQMKLYHIVCWSVPAISTFLGLFALYSPRWGCFMSAEGDFWRFLPNYIVSYAPMLAVMIANPALYSFSILAVHSFIVSYLSEYTRKERQVLDLIKLKFGLINLSFYICWLPNLINTFFLYALWDELPKRGIITVWYLMAVLNPLQAFFNSIVYRTPHYKLKAPWAGWILAKSNTDSEKEPLLPRINGYSTSDSGNFDD